jgi:chromosome segregation ATPase
VFVAALVGLVIGAAGSWLYMDGRLQPALQRITQSESSRDLATKAAKVLEEQIANAKQAAEKLQGTLKTLEQEASEAKDKLTRVGARH